ncbi:MAG: ribonuclease HI [bacterium]|jgi:ribonuclease HI|nr:ribonuclease HI [bacterium]
MKHVKIYTDGACKGNPGPGGYGVVLQFGPHRRELSGGFRNTTNNRMELQGCIAGLQALKYPCSVTIYCDSKYLVDAYTKGWARKWRINNWKRNKKERAENTDLWGKLLDLCDNHRVTFSWIKGHSGHPENERCDQLASEAALKDTLPVDRHYELDS